MFYINFRDKIGQNYKTMRMKYVWNETLGTKLVNTLNIGDEKCTFPLKKFREEFIRKIAKTKPIGRTEKEKEGIQRRREKLEPNFKQSVIWRLRSRGGQLR